MGNFGRNDKGGNRGGGFRGGHGGGRSGFGGRRDGSRSPVTMHKAICDKCNKSCEVPFRPSEDKPVYCNECFGGKRDGGNRGDRKDFGDRKPRRDFSNNREQSFPKDANLSISNDFKKQLDDINTKIDRLVSIVESISSPKVSSSKIKEVSKSEKKPTKKVVIKSKSKVKQVSVKKKK